MAKDVEDGLTSYASIVDPDLDGSVMMVVRNHTGCPIFLEEEHLLGTLESSEVIPTYLHEICFLFQSKMFAEVDHKNEL